MDDVNCEAVLCEHAQKKIRIWMFEQSGCYSFFFNGWGIVVLLCVVEVIILRTTIYFSSLINPSLLRLIGPGERYGGASDAHSHSPACCQ